MITADTARQIWAAHKEIEGAQELLAAAIERVKTEAEHKSRAAGANSNQDPQPRYADIEMAIPYFHRTGADTSKRLYHLSASLAVQVIEAHIAETQVRLQKLMIVAKSELAA